MAVDERARHRFYNKAVEVFGEEEATILMAHLPPGGYPNLATKQDLLDLEKRMKLFMLWTVLTVNLTLMGAFTAVVLSV
jgi:hypothetical protein